MLSRLSSGSARSVSRCIVLMAVALLTGAAAVAPSVKLVIVKAEFGDLANDKTIDVTAKVAALVKDNSLTISATPANLGKPPASPSKLKVGYTLDGIYRSKTVDEGETLDISTHLLIVKAVYGDLPGGSMVDVTDQVSDMVRKNTLAVTASNDLFTDPAEGHVKKLRVDYTFDGVAKSKTVAEGQSLSISDKGE